MGNKKEQTLLNRFRLEDRLFENTLKSLQQNVLDNQPVPVLRTILRNLFNRHQQLTDITQQLTGFLANDALETLFDSMSRISSEFENAELQVSLKETDHHLLPTRSSSTASRQFQQNFCNEYTDFPPVSPPLSQSQQHPSLPMDQTVGSVFPTAACQLQSVVEASTTPAVTLCSNEPTTIVTCGNPFGSLPTRVPPVLPQTRRQNSAVHPFQNDDRTETHLLAENTYLVPPNPASVIQLPFDSLAPDRTPLETQSSLINTNSSPVPHISCLAPTEQPLPVLVSRLPNSCQEFNQPLQAPSNFLPVPPPQFNQIRFVSQQQLQHASVPSAASNIAFVQSSFGATLPPTTNDPVRTERVSRPFPIPQPFPHSSITAATSFAATSHAVPTNAISTIIDGSSRPIASTHTPTIQPSTYIPTHTQPPAIKLPPLQLPMFDGNPLQYHDWINTFKATVHSNMSITDTHRITYLQNSVSGPAKDLIKGYSYNPTFYAAALADFEKRFGVADYIVASYITKLETFPQFPLHDAKSITAYNTSIEEFTRIFSDLGFSSNLTSSTVLRLAKDKLPKPLLVKWTEYTIQKAIAKPSLLHFQIWLELQTAVYDKLNLPSSSKTQASSFKPKSDSGGFSTRDTHRNPTTQRKHPPSCPFCSLAHYASICSKYREATLKQRFNFVKNHNLCLNCLGKDHMKSSCPSKNRCSKHDCSELHHTTLHEAFNQPHARSQPDQELSRNTSNATRGTDLNRQRPIRSPPTDPPTRPSQFNATALNRKTEKFPKDLLSVLQIVPVSVINDDKIFDTYALIDPGSSGTYILDHITKTLNLKTSESFDLDVQFLSISRSISVSSTHFLLAPYADHEKTFPVRNVFSTPSINLPPADTKELNEICQQFRQLRHNKFPDIDNGKIGILLGTACVQFTHAVEWIRGASNCPAGVRTELGWTIAGELTHPKRAKLPPRVTTFSSLHTHHLPKFNLLTCWKIIGPSKKPVLNPLTIKKYPLKTKKPFGS